MIVIRELVDIVTIHELDTEVLAASIRNPLHMTQAALAGAHVATLPFKVLQQMVHHPLTTSGIVQFRSDWEKAREALGREEGRLSPASSPAAPSNHSPARITRLTRSPSSSSTRSARRPTAIRPRSSWPSIAERVRARRRRRRPAAGCPTGRCSGPPRRARSRSPRASTSRERHPAVDDLDLHPADAGPASARYPQARARR